MKTKSFTVSILEENGEVFFNIDIPETQLRTSENKKSPVVETKPEPEQSLFNYGWCTSPVGLNIRAKADLNSQVIGVLDDGQRFKIDSKIDNWYKISAPISGYIDSEYTAVSTDTTQIDSALVDFTASWEGFRSRAYKDAGGNWTIGFGDCTFQDAPTYTVTYQQAWNTLKNTLNDFAKQIAELTLGLNLNQHEFNSCVDFAYNLGVEAFAGSDLLCNMKQCLNNTTITADFTAWDHCDGNVLPGLLRRRQAEATLFLTGKYDNN